MKDVRILGQPVWFYFTRLIQPAKHNKMGIIIYSFETVYVIIMRMCLTSRGKKIASVCSLKAGSVFRIMPSPTCNCIASSIAKIGVSYGANSCACQVVELSPNRSE